MKDNVFAVQLVIGKLQCGGLHRLWAAVIKGQDAYIRIR